MPPSNSQDPGRKNLNHGNHILDLPTGTKIHLRNRLYNKGKKVRSCAPFFRLNGILPTDGLTKETPKPIPIGKTTQSTKQPIPIGEREKRSRR
jgi:hypothetical protein